MVLLRLAMCVWLLLQHGNNSHKSDMKLPPRVYESSLTALTMKTNTTETATNVQTNDTCTRVLPRVYAHVHCVTHTYTHMHTHSSWHTTYQADNKHLGGHCCTINNIILNQTQPTYRQISPSPHIHTHKHTHTHTLYIHTLPCNKSSLCAMLHLEWVGQYDRWAYFHV